MQIAVIGVGNILYRDDGLGVYAVRLLEANYEFPGSVELVDGGTLGFRLMDYFESCDRVLVLDTVSIDAEPGTVYTISSERLLGLGGANKTAHEAEVVQLLEACTLLDQSAEVMIVGMVPGDILSVEIGLSPQVDAAFEALIMQALDVLKSWDIEAVRKEEPVTLETIIGGFGVDAGRS